MAHYESSSPNDWDVEQYRHPWDSDEQWDLRKRFILAHKDSIPEDQLVCWAQVFANMELLQCSYPDEVEEQVKSLGGGLSKNYHEKKKELASTLFQPKLSGNSSRSERSDKRQCESQGIIPTQHACMKTDTDKSTPTNCRKSTVLYSEQLTVDDVSLESAGKPVNNYQMPSYYTSSYKLSQRQAASTQISGVAPHNISHHPNDGTVTKKTI